MRRAWIEVLRRPATTTPVPAWASEAFARVGEAAAGLGLSPAQLEAESFPGSSFAALAEARDWSHATCCKYAKAGWAHGVALPRLPTPEPLGGPPTLPELYLVDDGSTPPVVRAAVWCRLAAVWPAPLPAWSALRTTDLEIDDRDVLLQAPDLDAGHGAGTPDTGAAESADVASEATSAPLGVPVRIVGAGELTRRWLSWRQRLPGDALLCTLRAGPGSAPGSPLAERSLEVAFRAQATRALALAGELGHRHADRRRLARRATYETLTYDTYRRLLLDAGVAPIAPRARGTVRATR